MTAKVHDPVEVSLDVACLDRLGLHIHMADLAMGRGFRGAMEQL
jgi:hypothetical protein